MELTTKKLRRRVTGRLFMITKIQNLNGTHNASPLTSAQQAVVYDYKDTKFEWNSQRTMSRCLNCRVVYDYKDTKFEWNSQLASQIDVNKSGCL